MAERKKIERKGEKRVKEGERTSARMLAQLNYRRFLIPRKESRRVRERERESARRAVPADSSPATGSLKIEAIYEHNVKSNTMQTLISRARDISPRAGRCNISRKRVCLFSSLLLTPSRLYISLSLPISFSLALPPSRFCLSTACRLFCFRSNYPFTTMSLNCANSSPKRQRVSCGRCQGARGQKSRKVSFR